MKTLLLVVLLFVVLAVAPAPSSAPASPNAQKGILEILHEDNFDAGVANRRYYLRNKDGDDRVELKDIGKEAEEKMKNMRSGEEVEIEHGKPGEKGLQIRSTRSARDEMKEAEAHGAGRNDDKRQVIALPPYSPKAKGTFNVLYIMLSWPEIKINATACSKANIAKYHGPRIQTPYKSFSYNQLNMVSVDVRTKTSPAFAGPYTLKTTAYNCRANIDKYRTEAFAAAAAQGINASLYDGVILGFPKHDFTKCKDGVALGGNWNGQAIVWNWLTECAMGDGAYNWHELGHGLKLSHAMYNGIEYGDQTATMGSAYSKGIHNAAHMDLLGWFTNTQRIRIAKPIAKTTYYLTALARGGARPLVLSIGDSPFGLDDYVGHWYVSYRQAYGSYEKVAATSGFAGLQIHRWNASSKTVLAKVLRTAGAAIQLKIPQGGYANVTLVSFNSTTARVTVVFVGCGTCTGIGATCGWVQVPGCPRPSYCGGCPQNGYFCNAAHKCEVLPKNAIAPNAGAAVYYPLPEPIQLVNNNAGQTVSCKGRDGAFAAGTQRNYDFAWCTSVNGYSSIPWWASALELVLTGPAGQVVNHEYRVVAKFRQPVQYADSIIWGQPGQLSARQFTLRPDSWSFNYSTTATDNIIADVVGYWAEPQDGRGDVNGLTPGYGFVPLINPVRIFSTPAFPSSVYNIGRRMNANEVIGINITLGGLPAGAAAVSGVLHADAASAAGRVVVHGGPRIRAASPLGQSAFNLGRETADAFLAPTFGSSFINIAQGAANAELALDAFGYFEQSAHALGLYYTKPIRILDTRSTTAFAAGEVRNIAVAGKVFGGVTVGADVLAVALMVTAVDGPSGSKSAVRVFPGPANVTAPAAYVLSAQGGIVTNNGVHVRLGADGSLNLQCDGPTQLIVDITALFKPLFPGANFAGTYLRAEVSPSASSSTSSSSISHVVIVVIVVGAVLAAALVAVVLVVVLMKRRAAVTAKTEGALAPAATPYKALYEL